jgi:hypothetical protein
MAGSYIYILRSHSGTIYVGVTSSSRSRSPSERAGNDTGWPPRGHGKTRRFKRKEMRADMSVITTSSYYKSVVYYSRIMAYFHRNGMLSSSGDSPKRFHRFFRGRDSMREHGESPLLVLRIALRSPRLDACRFSHRDSMQTLSRQVENHSGCPGPPAPWANLSPVSMAATPTRP